MSALTYSELDDQYHGFDMVNQLHDKFNGIFEFSYELLESLNKQCDIATYRFIDILNRIGSEEANTQMAIECVAYPNLFKMIYTHLFNISPMPLIKHDDCEVLTAALKIRTLYFKTCHFDIMSGEMKTIVIENKNAQFDAGLLLRHTLETKTLVDTVALLNRIESVDNPPKISKLSLTVDQLEEVLNSDELTAALRNSTTIQAHSTIIVAAVMRNDNTNLGYECAAAIGPSDRMLTMKKMFTLF